jgi:hypothetical protein
VPSLPVTGSPVGRIGLLGFALLAVGGGLLILAGRRSHGMHRRA